MTKHENSIIIRDILVKIDDEVRSIYELDDDEFMGVMEVLDFIASKYKKNKDRIIKDETDRLTKLN